MSLILKPDQHIINEIHCDVKFHGIKWLGFDKYKNLLYGCRKKCDQPDENDREIFMLSVFGKTMKSIKTIRFPFATFRDNHTTAISVCGNYILIGDCFRNKIDEKPSSAIFFLFSIETGEQESYSLNETSLQTLFHHYSDNMEIYHGSEIGWILAICSQGTKLYLHRIIFDDVNQIKSCRLEDLTNLERSREFSDRPNICGKNALFLQREKNLLQIFDCKSKSWMSKQLSNYRPQNNGTTYRTICESCTSSQVLIAIPSYCRANEQNVQNESLYKLIGETWETMSIYLHSDCSTVTYITDSYCSANIICLKLMTQKPKCRERRQTIVFANTNVLSLHNLAMKKIFASFNHLSEQKLMEITNLPMLLKRQYFGPLWTC